MNKPRYTIKGTYKQKYESPLNFRQWDVILNRKTGIVLLQFSGENLQTKWHLTPQNPDLKKIISFHNEKEWETLKEKCKAILKIQKEKFPIQHEEQQNIAETEKNFLLTKV